MPLTILGPTRGVELHILPVDPIIKIGENLRMHHQLFSVIFYEKLEFWLICCKTVL